MNCRNIHKKLIFYLEEELTAEEKKEVEIHLSECTDCALFTEELKKTLLFLESDKKRNMNPYFFTRVKSRMEKQTGKPVNKNVPVLSRILQPAFFTLLLLAGIFTGIKIGQPGTSNQSAGIHSKTEIIPYLNEMQNETIESFLME